MSKLHPSLFDNQGRPSAFVLGPDSKGVPRVVVGDFVVRGLLGQAFVDGTPVPIVLSPTGFANKLAQQWGTEVGTELPAFDSSILQEPLLLTGPDGNQRGGYLLQTLNPQTFNDFAAGNIKDAIERLIRDLAETGALLRVISEFPETTLPAPADLVDEAVQLVASMVNVPPQSVAFPFIANAVTAQDGPVSVDSAALFDVVLHLDEPDPLGLANLQIGADRDFGARSEMAQRVADHLRVSPAEAVERSLRAAGAIEAVHAAVGVTNLALGPKDNSSWAGIVFLDNGGRYLRYLTNYLTRDLQRSVPEFEAGMLPSMFSLSVTRDDPHGPFNEAELAIARRQLMGLERRLDHGRDRVLVVASNVVTGASLMNACELVEALNPRLRPVPITAFSYQPGWHVNHSVEGSRNGRLSFGVPGVPICDHEASASQPSPWVRDQHATDPSARRVVDTWAFPTPRDIGHAPTPLDAACLVASAAENRLSIGVLKDLAQLAAMHCEVDAGGLPDFGPVLDMGL